MSGDVFDALLRGQRSAIRDPVWGDIALGERELAVVDTAPFQRLRHIQQLGFTSLTFPGAHHTRFEHSLGVYSLTRAALLRLLELNCGPHLTSEDVLTGLAAALLHDVGHYPFSHAVEELELATLRSHEAISQHIIQHSEVASVLRDRWGVDPRRVARLIRHDPDLDGVDVLLSSLVTGALDTDKLDYLVRDARACNVPYGVVDVDRLLHALRVWTEPGGRPRLVVDEKGVGPMQSLVFAKYLMFANVYWHHTSRVATVMLLRAIHDALDSGIIASLDVENSDDRSLLTMLRERSPSDSSTFRLVGALEGRALYKRAVVLTPDDDLYGVLKRLKAFPVVRREVERHWVSMMRAKTRHPLTEESILLDIPESKRFATSMDVICDVPPRGFRNPVPWSVVSGLTEQDMARYQYAVHRVRIVAASEDLARDVEVHQDHLLAAAAHLVKMRGVDRARPVVQSSLEL